LRPAITQLASCINPALVVRTGDWVLARFRHDWSLLKIKLAPFARSAYRTSMDREMLQRHLAQAEQHTEAGRKHIARQREIITELECDGHETTTAWALMDQLEQAQAMHIADRERILRELGKEAGPNSG
jgi:hypothetical protein